MIRSATPEDAPAIAILFHRTVRLVNRHDYSPAQVAAWAGPAPDPEKWLGRQSSRLTWVEEAGGILRGFAELQPNGQIDAFYVSADHQRQGIGAALLQRIEAAALARGDRGLATEASITAVPFFTAHGYHVTAEQDVRYQGVLFRNFRMSKALGLAS